MVKFSHKNYMNYPEGVQHMKDLSAKLGQGLKSSFTVGDLVINYPGYKEKGDYQLTINGKAPNHTDIVRELYNATNLQNLNGVIAFLDDIYKNGLNATSTMFSRAFIQKIYWITLQEEINYPQPIYKGRKLPFQRFYEGALAKVNPELDLTNVLKRTNNHSSGVPELINIQNHLIPSFYN
jgi:hypothetical protein